MPASYCGGGVECLVLGSGMGFFCRRLGEAKGELVTVSWLVTVSCLVSVSTANDQLYINKINLSACWKIMYMDMAFPLQLTCVRCRSWCLFT